jgi:putative oxidoreductase
MSSANRPIEWIARVLLAAIFVYFGFDKIGGYAGTAAYMASHGVPAALLPLVIALELGGGIAIVAGYRTRLVAAALAAFSIVSGLLFHAGADPAQQTQLFKNVALAGGFLLLVVNGAGAWSLDARRERQTAPGEFVRGHD